MKNIIRTTAIAALCVSASLKAAQATDNYTYIHTAQMHLAALGYEVGTKDGVMGPMTTNAVMDFQARSGLPVTGKLDTLTYQSLRQTDDAARRYTYGYNNYVAPRVNMAYLPAPQTMTYDRIAPAALWNDWRPHSQTVPVRYGNLLINEDNRGNVRDYSVTLNGQPLLRAANQPGVLRVSQTYTMSGEDAVIFTAYDGSGGCAYKNYLVTIRSDGSATAPQAVGNCAGAYQARVDGNSLFISFPNAQYASDAATWDSWRYGNSQLVRI